MRIKEILKMLLVLFPAFLGSALLVYTSNHVDNIYVLYVITVLIVLGCFLLIKLIKNYINK